MDKKDKWFEIGFEVLQGAINLALVALLFGNGFILTMIAILILVFEFMRISAVFHWGQRVNAWAMDIYLSIIAKEKKK